MCVTTSGLYMLNPLALMSNRLLAAVQLSPSTRPCLKFHKCYLPCGLSDAAGKRATQHSWRRWCLRRPIKSWRQGNLREFLSKCATRHPCFIVATISFLQQNMQRGFLLWRTHTFLAVQLVPLTLSRFEMLQCKAMADQANVRLEGKQVRPFAHKEKHTTTQTSIDAN